MNIKSVKILLLKKDLEQSFIQFLNSLTPQTLSTYTRWGETFDSTLIAKNIFKNIQEGNEVAWVALYENTIIGYQHINFIIKSRNIVRDGSLVLQHYSGCGVGSLLKKHCISYCKKNNIFKIIATVYENNLSSLRSNLNNKFCITGIFFNEEKMKRKPRYVISMERPIKAKANCSYYFSTLKYFQLITPKQQRKNNLQIYFISKNELLKKTHKNNLFFSKKQMLIIDKIQNLSKIIFYKTNNFVTDYALLEFFTNSSKIHVSKLHIYSKTGTISRYSSLISNMLKVAKSKKLEKIWINVPSNNKSLLYSLISQNFIVESISYQHHHVNSSYFDVISLSYHFTNYCGNPLQLSKELSKI